MTHQGNYPSLSLQSYNYPTRYIRHRHFLGELTEISTDLDKNDATFLGGRGDRNPVVGESVAFEACNWRRFYLRHQDFVVKLHEEHLVIDPDRPPTYRTPESGLFYADAGFRLVPGLADSTCVSIRSVNYPDRYLRHRGFKLYLEPANDDLARADATFRITDGLVPGPPRPDIR
ncbi:Alpha-L-arabinofuranosidase B (ABFB) domain-containing protein [Lentzea albidocapillata subsp. violacea]|uniref:Alpha-L-arabinofuranosidase B (ABFB) domain-containing protein n=1 Tax=Lentzea albidocapillata subsp. violacea TaxID=128104 RepID=A0A1G9TQQ0_9PSEU|nr:AbfB domain-containing protein [Lentzea albidocapillata]SDM50013.1 Alpha-L-arabinofuranosidase B (ABFB) domain-containing protein [Lentzea albidocapillata subsp. violacea]